MIILIWSHICQINSCVKSTVVSAYLCIALLSVASTTASIAFGRLVEGFSTVDSGFDSAMQTDLVFRNLQDCRQLPTAF